MDSVSGSRSPNQLSGHPGPVNGLLGSPRSGFFRIRPRSCQRRVLYVQKQCRNQLGIGEQIINTSGNGQGGKVVFGHSEASRVVGSDAEVVPGGGFQVQNHVVVIGLHVVRNLVPLNLIAAEVNNLRSNSYAWLKCDLPLLALHHKVRHGASSIFPGLEVQGHRVGRHFNEARFLGQLGLLSLGPGVQNVRSFASSNAI